jgi:hypothetical protein
MIENQPITARKISPTGRRLHAKRYGQVLKPKLFYKAIELKTKNKPIFELSLSLIRWELY